MISLIRVLINSILFYNAGNHVLEKRANLNTSLISLHEDPTTNHYSNNLTDFIFTVSNSSDLEDFRIEPKSKQVDCFGLGKTLATTLEWFFMGKPNGTNALDVQFLLSSRRQPQRVNVLIGEQFSLEWADFKIERRTVVIVHGFLSHSDESWIQDMQRALLKWVR